MFYYRPQTKLQEDNVFTGVCLSIGGGGRSNASWDRSHGRAPPPPMDIRPENYLLLLSSGDQHWRPVQTCSHEKPPAQWHLVVATEARTVCKRTVRILWNCFWYWNAVHSRWDCTGPTSTEMAWFDENIQIALCEMFKGPFINRLE